MCENNVLSRAEVEALLSEIIKDEGIVEGKLVIGAGSSKGDGFMSYMTRVDVLGKNKDLHLIIKCAPKNAELRKIAPVNKFFNREITFYSQIYPAMKAFQEGRGIPTPFNSVAKCYKADLTEFNEFLVLENIRKIGFDLWDKRSPMDENHIQLLLKEYARFHAVSYAMQEQEPKKFAELVQDFPSLLSPKYVGQQFFDSIAMCFEKLAGIFGEEEEIRSKIQNLKENILDYILYINKGMSKFPTIVHGDSWCNNIMFKYKDPMNKLNPTEVCILDFQLCCLSSPILDLSYFLYSNSTKENFDKLDSYLGTYHDHLSLHLQALGCGSKAITKKELKSEWALFSKYGFMLSLIVIRSALVDPGEEMDFTDLMDSGRPMSDLFFREMKNKDLMDKKYEDLGRHMYENGFLDFGN